MKKNRTVLLALATILLTSCAATRAEQSPLEGARGNALIAQPAAHVIEQDESLQNYEKEDEGDTVVRTISHENLPITINVDATIERLLDSEAVSTIKVKPHLFSQEEADRIFEVLIGDGYFANVDTQSLDDPEFYSLIEKSLLWDERTMEIVQQDPEKFGGDQEFFKNGERNLNDLRYLLEEAQPLEDFPAGSKEFSLTPDAYGMPYSQIMGFSEKNGDPYRLWILNDESHTETFLNYSRFPMGWYYNALKSKDVEAAATPNVDYEKTKKEAQEIADTITGSQMVIAVEQGIVIEDIEGYNYIRFTFVRTANNAQMTYDPRYLVNDLYNGIDYLEEADYTNYQEPWNYERFEICMDNNGVQALHWTYPSETVDVVAENVDLLSFEQIMDVFENMFFVKNSLLENTSQSYIDEDGNELFFVDRIDVNITEIKLGLARVQAGKEYVLIPVWDFFGNNDVLTPNGEDYYLYDSTPESQEHFKRYKASERSHSQLTISAIDGSIVDRDTGY